ncbi:ELM1/GtrOC1 family putative glycosyltransferase [Hansschlegelia quercus]|uniref:Nucleoside-diphosphate sugar epimerase n=1 Tax=Hansschlegelia quercus TaxID=2528245 RepID=A0A4Q9GGZ5_9HYPH|nr:ELM1/GtrOC1 family putative glycosyltransferase [Hansschlegelia quercus]TBN53419.1 nucleoside-diphosphate sugar epimerase [Hansschlegelia quercus]
MAPDDSEAPVWVLLGRRAGDNAQLLTLAAATSLPFREKRLAFNGLSSLPNVLLRATAASLKPQARAILSPPWPRVVFAAGKRSAPAARWIKAQSGGATRLVHIGRPWAPLDWFDLIVTTAQYGLPERPNVLVNALPLSRTPADAPIRDDLAALPQPRLMAIAGGPSRPLAFDAETARAFAQEALERARIGGGSLLVATSPRTPPAAVAAIKDGLSGAAVPTRLSVFGEGESGWEAFLAAADRFLVTEDSAAMAAQAALRGKPVSLFALPRQRDARLRFAAALRDGPARGLFETLRDAGLVTSTRDLSAFMARLEREGLLAGGDAARLVAERELAATAARVRALAEQSPGVG